MARLRSAEFKRDAVRIALILFPQKKSVTHVSGTFCYLSLRRAFQNASPCNSFTPTATRFDV